jgi:hypothetical protein
MMPWKETLGARDVALITLDSLRHDAATAALRDGRTPHLAALLPDGGWEERHAPATYTFASHQSFFAGFLPTPTAPGPHRRPIALRFAGSETIGPGTLVFDAPDIVAGFAAAGYHTCCIGSTGFFNPRTPLGSVLPKLFAESHWSPDLGVGDPRSTERQVRLAVERMGALPAGRRLFLFINVGATHRPTRAYLPGAPAESVATQAAALAYVDRQLPPLFAAMRARGGCRLIICSDHGTCFGDDGYQGHRLAHPAVWTVPYAEACVEP